MNTDKFKVVCIVKNDSNRNSEGLRNAFNEQTNTFIEKYFYTSAAKFSEEFGNNTKNKFLLINQNSVTPNANPPGNDESWDILLVCDNTPIEIIRNIPFIPVTLVMYHQEPSDAKSHFEGLQKDRKIRKCKHGQHVYNPSEGYQRLFELTEAWHLVEQTGKFNPEEYNAAKKKIIDWFGVNEKLNAALEFLHKSLGVTPANKSILTEGEERFDLTKKYKEKSLEKWIEDLKGKTGDEYNAVLRNVRDGLLQEAGVII
jgi:hypothetical protein